MAKTKVRYCRNCMRYTEQIYKGKEPKDKETAELDRIGYVATMGIYFVLDKITGDDRPKFWKCKECSRILKE